jgi:hypothetical protein
MKKLIIVANDAQACGKSTTALLLEQYLIRRQFRVARGITHPDQELPTKAEVLDLDEGFSMQELVDAFYGVDAFIIDCQTASHGALGQILREGGIEEILAELDAELTVIIPVCDDAEVLRGARDAAEEFSGLGEFIVINQPLESDVPEAYASSATEKVLRYLGAAHVSLPAPSLDTIENLLDMDLDLPLGLTQRGLLPRYLMHQLLSWEVECGERIKNCEALLHPTGPKEDDSAYGPIVLA